MQQQRLKQQQQQQALMQPTIYHPGLLAPPQIEPILSGNLPPGFDSSTCRSVYVGNIHPQVTEPLLQEVFSSTGLLEGCKLIRKEKSSYGFVDYFDRRSAALAIVTLNGRQLFGQPIKVNWACSSRAMALFTTRRTLATVLRRTLSSPSTSRSRLAVPLLNLQNPTPNTTPNPFNVASRSKTSGSGYSPLNDPSPNWSNRPPKETILLDGCDYEHWLIVMEFPTDPKPSEEEMINSYIKTLANVVGSEEEAKKKIYSVCTTTYTGFGALVSEELSHKVKDLPGVLWVLPDSYLDVPNKDYGGDLFVDGKVIHRPQYRFNERQQTRSRPRPRYDRRRETMQVERREPRAPWSPNQQAVPQRSTAINGQNASQSDGAGYRPNQAGFHGNSAPNQPVPPQPQYPTQVNSQSISQSVPYQGEFQGRDA